MVYAWPGFGPISLDLEITIASAAMEKVLHWQVSVTFPDFGGAGASRCGQMRDSFRQFHADGENIAPGRR